MIDKALVKRRFEGSLDTYDENAVVQKIMAEKLISMLDCNRYKSVFEIGCATGILTKKIKEKFEFEHFYANDIVESAKDYIKKITEDFVFIEGDIEEIDLSGKYDLIISNACLQWCNNLTVTTDKLYNSLEEGGILALSIFGEENLREIKSLFNIENKEYSIDKLKEYLNKYNCTQYYEEQNTLYFDCLADVLRHLKYTGVNALTTYRLTKNKLKEIENSYRKLYSRNDKLSLTYNPVFIIIKKSI